MPLQAVIFDMDGVICDTEAVHAAVEQEIFHKYGVENAPIELFQRYAGISFREAFPEFCKHLGVTVTDDIQEIEKRKIQMMMEACKGNVQAIEGTIELMQALREAGIPIGVASGSPLIFIHLILHELNILSWQSAVTSADEVPRGKPSPDVFLETARRMKVESEHCIVIEDAMSGMRAAKAAGMKCVGFVKHPTGLEPADIVVKSMKEISVEMLRRL